MQTISLRGGAEHNLKSVDIDIPKHKLTVFTGVSGSGKSSLVFGTIAQESKRLLNETYPAYIQGFMPAIDRPAYDSLEGLTCSIVVQQERLGANVRSTVATASDAAALLRSIFLKLASPKLPSTDAYSFNIPSASGGGAIEVNGKREVKHFEVVGGMCPTCEGTGRINQVSEAAILDENLSINEGAIKVPGYKVGGWSVKVFSDSGLYNPDIPIREFSTEERRLFLYGEPQKLKIGSINMTYEGLITKLKKSLFAKDPSDLKPNMKAFCEGAVGRVACPDCAGTRFAKHTLASTISIPKTKDIPFAGCALNIAEVFDLEAKDLLLWLDALALRDDIEANNPAVLSLKRLASSMVELGIGYIALSRAASTLSGGEAQRLKLVKHLHSALSDVTYIFDEPTAGLHPKDIEKMCVTMQKLRDKGNTVLVVEHKREMIEEADHIVDLGPGAGAAGGNILFEGSVSYLKKADTPTAHALSHSVTLKETLRKSTGCMPLESANSNNLKDVSVTLPKGVLTVIAGVAGSGKSSLIHNHFEKQYSDCVSVVDQSTTSANRRSNIASFTGILDQLRKAMAKASGKDAGLFSSNSTGACPACSGVGKIETQLSFTETVSTRCTLCHGAGYSQEARETLVGGLSIVDVLSKSALEAQELFSSKGAFKLPKAAKMCQQMVDANIGYITLGQALPTLSGGERQRLKLATQLDTTQEVLILDEPTVGLHLQDIKGLLSYLDSLVDSGKTLIVIEHHLDVVAHADWVVELGPQGGQAGGEIIFEGTPHELIKANTPTGTYLAAALL